MVRGRGAAARSARRPWVKPCISEADALARLSQTARGCARFVPLWDLARAEVLAAGRGRILGVTFNRESVAGVTENMVTVTQALPISGRRDLEVSAASALVEASAGAPTKRSDACGPSSLGVRRPGLGADAGDGAGEIARDRCASLPTCWRGGSRGRRRRLRPPPRRSRGHGLEGDWRRRVPIARARRPALAAFFADPGRCDARRSRA